MGKEGAGWRSWHQFGHLPLVDGPVQLCIASQGPVPEFCLLPRGAMAEVPWEHLGFCGGGWGLYSVNIASLPHRGVGIIRFIGLINLKFSNV